MDQLGVWTGWDYRAHRIEWGVSKPTMGIPFCDVEAVLMMRYGSGVI